MTDKIAACIIGIDNKDIENAIQIFPAGKFDAPNGSLKGQGPWQIDKASAEKLISAVSSRKNPMLIDYEHQSLLAAKNGKPVPAAGWIFSDSLFWVDGKGLFAKSPKWTEAAASMINADEYRYLSPVFSYDAKTGTPTNLLSVSLTNTPAIDNMAAVSIAATNNFNLNLLEQPMETSFTQRLAKSLGLSETATEQDIETAAASMVASINEQKEQIAALSTVQKPNPAEFVPVSVMAELQKEVAALTAQISVDKVSQTVEAALSSGKLLPAQKEWALSLDLAALTAYLAVAQPIAALQGNQTDGKKKAEPIAATTLEQQWQSDSALQSEFVTSGDYVAYKLAEQSGKIRILGANE